MTTHASTAPQLADGLREIVLDTETTGFDPKRGDRLVEIGCVELVDMIPSGRVFHQYIDPKRDVPASAFAVHGLDRAFLSQHPPFEEIAEAFLAFVEEAPLIIHNARFDMKFLTAELKAFGFRGLKNPVVDTLTMAREKFPGAPASLDMLCSRFNVDSSKRDKHGALLDAELLAAVYLELNGGRQPGLALANEKQATSASATDANTVRQRKPRTFPLSDTEIKAHDLIIETLKSGK